MFLIVTCTSCKATEPYLTKDYLNYLAKKTGISISDNINDNFIALKNYKVINGSDYTYLEDELNYAFMSKTICNLLELNGNPIDILIHEGFIKQNVNENKKVEKNIAIEVVDKAVDRINNKTFESKAEYRLKDNIKEDYVEIENEDIFLDKNDNSYKRIIDNEYTDVEFEDVYSYMDIADSFEIDFTNAEIIPLQDEVDDTSYINNKFNLLASKNKVFNKDGFRISYSFNSSGLDFHISKQIKKVTVYADASIKSVKPTFKWTYDDGDLKNCYFNIKFNSTTSLGCTMGKYGNYYLKFKDLDNSSFLSKLKSMIAPHDDEVEAMIPICTIKTPIPNVPFATLNMTVGIKLYVSGKVELILYNAHNIGFEVKNGCFRAIYDHNDDIDSIIRASAKAALALNLGLDTTNFRLCDIELDGGVKSEVKSTLHLYDTDFIEETVTSDVAYSTLEEISKDNPYVKVCGDLSLYWLLDLVCNTSKSILYKWGFTKTFHISDDNNQIFNNLHHIEDGKFVKNCTRKTKVAIKNESLNINSANKILLNSYAEVLNINETFNIEILGVPEGYSISNIKYSSSDSSVAKIDDGKIIAIKAGSAKINVHTNDNKYSSYINILVSTG